MFDIPDHDDGRTYAEIGQDIPINIITYRARHAGQFVELIYHAETHIRLAALHTSLQWLPRKWKYHNVRSVTSHVGWADDELMHNGVPLANNALHELAAYHGVEFNNMTG